MFRSSLICLAALALQVNSAPNYDLKSIFQTPVRRNYDQLEILERSNFDSESPDTCTNAVEKPKSVANAQVLLRFGGDKERKCACGDLCQCRISPPYYYPPQIPPCYCMPQYQQPPFLPFYPPYHPPYVHPLQTSAQNVENQPQPTKTEKPVTPPIKSQIVVEDNSRTNQVNIVQNDHVVNGGSQVVSNSIVKNNHPQILNTITLPEEVAQPPRPVKVTNDLIENDIENFERVTKNNIVNKIEPCRVSPNVKFVAVDLSEAPKKPERDIYDLEDALVSHVAPQVQQPKYLVPYPIFNRPRYEEERLPVPYRRGYSCSSSSSYYSDPVKTVVYKKPPVLQILGHPSVPVPVEPTIRKISYICIPVSSTILPGHGPDCSCCGCTKYVGELNEAGL